MGRLIDPRHQVNRVADEASGVISQRSLADRQDEQARFGAEPSRQQNYIYTEQATVYAFNPAASSAVNLARMFAASATTIALSIYNDAVSGQGRLLAVRLTASNVLTAGTVTAQLTVFEGADTTVYQLEDLTLAAGEETKSARYEWDTATQIANGSSWNFQIITDAAYLPVTLDYWAELVFGYATWVTT